MDVIHLDKQYIISGCELKKAQMDSFVFKSKDGFIIKTFNKKLIEESKKSGIDLESKILYTPDMICSSQINKPTSILYDCNSEFYGYMCKVVDGEYDTTGQYLETLRQSLNIYKMNELYKKIGEIVKKEEQVVFPDLCNVDNIVIGEGLNISLIDYDGMQIGKYRSSSISSNISCPLINTDAKYVRDNLYTKNLDKKSLIFLYFQIVFNINLNMFEGCDEKKLEEMIFYIFKILNIEDQSIMNKVWKLFKKGIDNDYLSDEEIDKIASYFSLEEFPIKSPGSETLYTLRKKYKNN